ncbi:hypothetical protein LY76DRAFT_236851 [Colletotrichum caudatum]|nr:hypothetical protein LY76DRAFT_236851 [Colletotrichum caudatum]
MPPLRRQRAPKQTRPPAPMSPSPRMRWYLDAGGGPLRRATSCCCGPSCVCRLCRSPRVPMAWPGCSKKKRFAASSGIGLKPQAQAQAYPRGASRAERLPQRGPLLPLTHHRRGDGLHDQPGAWAQSGEHCPALPCGGRGLFAHTHTHTQTHTHRERERDSHGPHITTPIRRPLKQGRERDEETAPGGQAVKTGLSASGSSVIVVHLSHPFGIERER